MRSFAQGLALITLLLDRSQHFALYVQGGVPNASDLNHGTNVTLYVQGGIADAPGLNRVSQVALYVQGLVLTTPLLDWSQHFALYVQGGVPRASGLGLANQVALYVQGLALITLSLDRSQLFALYVQGGIQDHSVEDRTPNVFQSLLNPTQLSRCSCCLIDQLTPGGLCLTPFPLNNELNPAKRGSVHLGTGFFGGIE